MIATVAVNLFLFIIIHQSAQVVKGNCRLEMANRNFYLNQFVVKRVLSNGKYTKIQGNFILKVQTLQTYNFLQFYGFRIVGNYRLTSNSYTLVLYTFKNIIYFVNN